MTRKLKRFGIAVFVAAASLLTLSARCCAQSNYRDSVSLASNLLKSKDYKKAAVLYSEIIRKHPLQTTVYQRYNAASAWAMAHEPDSAFLQLNLAVVKHFYLGHERLLAGSNFLSLHQDKRWPELITMMKAPLDSVFNPALKQQLELILQDDQRFRVLYNEESAKAPSDSAKLNEYARKGAKADSINLSRVLTIIDRFGWPSYREVGPTGISAMFLIIQHADLPTQLRLLPVMKWAVANRNLFPAQLAILEDRIAIRQGRKQIYGSQLTYNETTKKQELEPIQNEAEVDKRRAEVGLEPLKDYLKQFNVIYEGVKPN